MVSFALYWMCETSHHNSSLPPFFGSSPPRTISYRRKEGEREEGHRFEEGWEGEREEGHGFGRE